MEKININFIIKILYLVFLITISGDLSTLGVNADGCSINATWRDPAPSAAGPTSPAISANTKTIVTPLNSYDDWVIVGPWPDPLQLSQVANGSILNGIDVGGTLNATLSVPWGPTDYILASMKTDFYFRAGEKYTMNLDVLSIVANPVDYFYALQFCFIPGYLSTRTFTWFNPSTPKDCFSFPETFANLSISSAWTSHTLEFIPTKTYSKTTIGLSLFLNQTTTINSVFFRNVSVNIASKPVVAPTLLTKDSERVTLRKATYGLTTQNRTNCPHLQAGLLHWHNPATWGGSVPSPSSNITLPENSKVLISSCSINQTAVYQKITIPATSQLIFSDSTYTMNIHDIDVKGQFIMGTSECRMNGKITIIFNGQKTTSDTITQYLGSKGIAVSRGGYISVQGKQYYKTWTRLAATAYPFDTIIYLQDSVNWEVGHRVFITTSKYQDELDNQNEEMVIAAIQGKVVEFTKPLKFLHYGGQEYQAEVGLISRRIVFRGANDSDTDQFGGHVLTMGNGQFAGIQLTKMGQRNLKGRYPLHFHLSGVVNNSYISDCSVEKSYYRCYTIHGTHKLIVQQNTAYDVTGHCYYIEDGVEENNTISYNIAAFVHTIGTPASGGSQYGEIFYQNVNLTQPADSAASGYYITNAYNTIIGNAASGGWSSYAFPNLPTPIGSFRNMTDFSPMSRRTLEFDGNTAHSAGYFFVFGSCVYCGGLLWYEDPNVDSLTYLTGRQSRETYDVLYTPSWMRWTNLKTSQCNSGASHWGNEIEVDGYEAYDNEVSATIFGAAWMNNAIINPFSNNPVDERVVWGDIMVTRQGFQFYDTFTQTILTNINFRNLTHDVNAYNIESDNMAIVSLTQSDYNKPQQISATKNITYTNVPYSQRLGFLVRETGASRYFNFIDWDGSVTNGSSAKIVGSNLNWWNFHSSCVFNNIWQVWVCDHNGNQIGNIVLTIPDLIVSEGDTDGDYNVGNSSLFGPNLPPGPQTCIITKYAGITGILNMGWYIDLFNGKSPSSFKVETRQIPYGQYLLLALTYPLGTTFEGKRGNIWFEYTTQQLSAAASQSEVLNGDGTKFFFNTTTGNFFIKLVTGELTYDKAFTRGGVSVRDENWGYTYFINATCITTDCQRSDPTPVYPTWQA